MISIVSLSEICLRKWLPVLIVCYSKYCCSIMHFVLIDICISLILGFLITGDVKKLLVDKTGLETEEQRLFFRGIEKGDNQHLHLEGVKDKSKIFLMEGTASKERKLEETRKQNEMSKVFEAIAGVRTEVDKLSNRVSICLKYKYYAYYRNMSIGE